jgi:hypothetical protein
MALRNRNISKFFLSFTYNNEQDEQCVIINEFRTGFEDKICDPMAYGRHGIYLSVRDEKLPEISIRQKTRGKNGRNKKKRTII